jgi:hypothetical protein
MLRAIIKQLLSWPFYKLKCPISARLYKRLARVNNVKERVIKFKEVLTKKDLRLFVLQRL